MAITIDASTPAVTSGTGSATPLTTGSFTPPDSCLVLVLAAAGWGSAATTQTCSDSGAYTWFSPVGANGGGSNGGQAAVFYHYFIASPGAITVSIAYTNLIGGRYIDVVVLLGANPNQTGGSFAQSSPAGGTTGTFPVITSNVDSWVFGASNNSGVYTTWTANGITTKRGGLHSVTDGVEIVSWRGTDTTVTPASTTFGGTWGSSGTACHSAYEVIPDTGSGSATIAQHGSII